MFLFAQRESSKLVGVEQQLSLSNFENWRCLLRRRKEKDQKVMEGGFYPWHAKPESTLASKTVRLRQPQRTPSFATHLAQLKRTPFHETTGTSNVAMKTWVPPPSILHPPLLPTRKRSPRQSSRCNGPIPKVRQGTYTNNIYLNPEAGCCTFYNGYRGFEGTGNSEQASGELPNWQCL